MRRGVRDDVDGEARARPAVSDTSLTVSDTPSSVIEPLAAMRPASDDGTATAIRVESPSRAGLDHVADGIDVTGDDMAAELVADLAARVRG